MIGGTYLALNKLHDVYTLDTGCFYTAAENLLDNKLNKARAHLNTINKRHESNEYNKDLYGKHKKCLNYIIKTRKEQLKNELANNVNLVREVLPEKLIDKNVVSVFDSSLTRSLHMSPDTLNLELVIVKVYYFSVAESIIKNGFLMNGERYIFFSASAGQIRLKKFVAVKEESLNKCENTLTCGLNIEKINKLGGVNRNKFLAYKALAASATDEIDINIDKAIVVEDFETLVNGEVDFIDHKTFDITRQFMDVPINHTDGCGLILPKINQKNAMFRAPWIKGLLSPFAFDEFCKEHGCSGDIIDIYGKKYNIFDDEIEIIFTRSQFKMCRYYNNWQKYQENFKKYNCTAGICNEEDAFKDTKLNYQMLQTLTDVTEEELQYICRSTRNKIRRLASDIPTMLKVFGVTKYNTNKNSFQKCLEVYPELLQEIYTKETLRAIKKKLEKEAWAGKLDIYGKYTFLIPDLFAFCERLFLGVEDPKGLLKDGEVYCKLFKGSEKVNCLRSPHLERSHGVRNNIAKSGGERLKWFITNGVYTSCHDLISKLLQFDVDGDKALVVGDKKFVEIAERNMKDTVPLYYEMAKADPQILDSKILYEGMILAYTEGNIGIISNDISKIWNSENIDMDAVKVLAAQNNFTIDVAKTLYKPTIPADIMKNIRTFTKNKLPHFFIYAKDKPNSSVGPSNNSTVNRIKKYIPRHNLRFNPSVLGKFNYKILMRNSCIERDSLYEDVVKKYTELSKNVNMFVHPDEGDGANNYNYLFRKINSELNIICPDKYLLVDILIDNLFNVKKSKRKTVFWNCFGDIVFENIIANMINDYIYCSKCGKRFYRDHHNEILCENCKDRSTIGKKTIICVDCGKEFEVIESVKNKYRCNGCQKKHMRVIKTEKQRMYRRNA